MHTGRPDCSRADAEAGMAVVDKRCNPEDSLAFVVDAAAAAVAVDWRNRTQAAVEDIHMASASLFIN